jgi:hypothetical protein
MKTIEDFQDHELIKTNKVFWLLDHKPRPFGNGWPLPVYFDRTSDRYRVFDTTTHGVYFEASELPPLGPYEFESLEPIQFAKDVHLTTIKVIIKEI